MDYIISCESTVDMPYSYVEKRGLPVLFYTYLIDGVEYIDDMLRDPESLPNFYKMIDAGALPTTSQINMGAYITFFEGLLEHKNILHICLGTGMTNSANNAKLAASKVMEEHPDVKINVIDSTCSSGGYGLLVDLCCDQRDAGMSFEEVTQWCLAHTHKIHHQFFTTQLEFFKRSGRVSGPAAAIGTILGICPLMRLDDNGKIIAYAKARGKKNAIRETVKMMEEHAEGGLNYDGKAFIYHANVLEDAQTVKQIILEKFPNMTDEKVWIIDIGTIIASHTGRGTCALSFVGDERKPLK